MIYFPCVIPRNQKYDMVPFVAKGEPFFFNQLFITAVMVVIVQFLLP